LCLQGQNGIGSTRVAHFGLAFNLRRWKMRVDEERTRPDHSPLLEGVQTVPDCPPSHPLESDLQAGWQACVEVVSIEKGGGGIRWGEGC
jgi:hypothetical protein